MLQTLSGKKTFLIVIVALVYLAGEKLGYWACDKEIITALGFAAAAFLRAGIAKAAPPARESAAGSDNNSMTVL